MTKSMERPDVDTAASTVRVSFPASFEYMRLARLATSAVGAQVGFNIDEIEDLRIAVDELTRILIESAGVGVLEISFDLHRDAVRISGEVPAARAPLVEPVTRQILAVVVDEFEVDRDAMSSRFTCLKRREPSLTDD